MKLIKPYTQIINKHHFLEALKEIEKAGRICKKSEKYINETSAEKFVRMIIEEGHEAMLEFGPSISVLFVCDRGVSHELVRHRLCDFAQESTRYCNYSKGKFSGQVTFIIPCWMPDVEPGEYTNKPTMLTWLIAMEQSEENYLSLLNQGWKPEQARSVLPNSLKTEIVMKANIREWRHIFRLRTSKKAHPQMRELMIPLLREFQSSVPVLFDDIDCEE